MMVLDTNIISELMQANPDPLILRWFDRQPEGSLWTTSVTVFEVRSGLLKMSKGKRRQALEFSFMQNIEQDLDGRVLDFDLAAAEAAALIKYELRKRVE